MSGSREQDLDFSGGPLSRLPQEGREGLSEEVTSEQGLKEKEQATDQEE